MALLGGIRQRLGLAPWVRRRRGQGPGRGRGPGRGQVPPVGGHAQDEDDDDDGEQIKHRKTTKEQVLALRAKVVEHNGE